MAHDIDFIPNGEAEVVRMLLRNCAGWGPPEIWEDADDEDDD